MFSFKFAKHKIKLNSLHMLKSCLICYLYTSWLKQCMLRSASAYSSSTHAVAHAVAQAVAHAVAHAVAQAVAHAFAHAVAQAVAHAFAHAVAYAENVLNCLRICPNLFSY